MKNITYLFAFLLSLLILACASKPSESDAQKVAENLIKKNNSTDLIELVSMKKSNAEEMEFMGMKGYKIIYSAEIKTKQKCRWFENNPFSAGRTDGTLFGSWSNVRQGETKTFAGEFDFTKTENGWQGPDGQFY